jgi:predicted phosphate transport protein (TIGR00153 family)
MVFPVETEERVKQRALTICQDHLRKVVEITRKVPQLVDSFVKGDKVAVKQLHAEIRKAEEEVDIARRMVAQELAEIGAILISREDFLRFTNLANEIADFCEGIAFRLMEIMERGWKVPMDIKKSLARLADSMFETVSKLRETVMMLNYGAEKVSEKSREVEVAENVVDDVYRDLEVKILNCKLDIPVLLLLRDVLQLIEDAADKAEDVSDAARILAFAM